jgi:hypothetical protein
MSTTQVHVSQSSNKIVSKDRPTEIEQLNFKAEIDFKVTK